MSGRSEFKVTLNMVDVADITDRAADRTSVKTVKEAIDAGASLEDIRTVEVLSALITFMQERHCDPGFEMVLSERD